MKKKLLLLLPWLIPMGLVGAGLYLRQNITTRFLGLICYGSAAVLWAWLGIFLLGRYRQKPAKLLGIALASVLILGMAVASGTGIRIASQAGADAAACEYIVVLGAKVDGTEPGTILHQRIRAAFAYLQAHPEAVAVVSGGQGPDEGISEAQCMYNGLTAMGIAPERIWLEDQSTSTWENLHFSLALIEERTGSRPERLGIVSNEFHLCRAKLTADRCGVQGCGIPAKTEEPIDFLNYFLRETVGIWKYIILGG